MKMHAGAALKKYIDGRRGLLLEDGIVTKEGKALWSPLYFRRSQQLGHKGGISEEDDKISRHGVFRTSSNLRWLAPRSEFETESDLHSIEPMNTGVHGGSRGDDDGANGTEDDRITQHLP